MAQKFSTGLRAGMMNASGAYAQLNGGILRIFGGAVPADADAAETGTLLAEYTDNGGGGGLNFTSPTTPTMVKAPAQVWKENSVNATGNATYFRFVAAGDTAAASTTEARVQGSAGLAGSDLVLNAVLFTSGEARTLNYFSITLPT